MNKENVYTIYKFTFSDGKVYIGQTSLPVEDRWKNGEGYKGQEVYIPITVEGWNNIKKEILHEKLTLEQADKLEQYYIKKFNSQKNGYNKNKGGCKSNALDQQKHCYINRMEFKNYETVNFIPTYLFNIADDLTGGELKVYLYLCAQVPHSYDGKRNPKNLYANKTFDLYPAAIKKVYPSLDIKTIRKGIEGLIKKGILILSDEKKNLYLFEDVPIKYRGLKVEEFNEIEDIKGVEEVYAEIHQKELRQIAFEQIKNSQDINQNSIEEEKEEDFLELLQPKKPRPKYSWE